MQLTYATYSAAAGVLLAAVSFVSFAIYYEHLLNPDWSANSFRTYYDLNRISAYTWSFSWIAVIVGVILAIKGLAACGWDSATAILRRVDLRTVLTLLLAVLVLLLLAALVMIVSGEFGDGLDYDALRIVWRINTYLTQSVTVVEGFIIFVAVNSLRRAAASIKGTKTNGWPSRPR